MMYVITGIWQIIIIAVCVATQTPRNTPSWIAIWQRQSKVLEKENITEVLSLINEINAQAWLLVVVKTLPHDKLTRVVLRLLGNMACEAQGCS